jgi:hypothetical protein
MLAVSVLMSAANAMAVALASPSARTPSRNPCMIRVEQTRYRNDPYNFRVLPPSPMHSSGIQAATPSKSNTFHAISVKARPAPIAPVALAQSPMKSVAPVEAIGTQKKAPVTRFAIVNFKHESKTFIAPFKIQAGDIVVVEGDRGENIGTVEEITTEMPSYAVPCKVVRKATQHDLSQLASQRVKEAEATATVDAAMKTLGLRATVVDCEFQFDLNKLSIFVKRPTKNAFVDFRKLQRGLFRDFRCRIWLNYMDEVEAANAAPRFQ